MFSDPHTIDRLLNYMSKFVWLILAFTVGKMAGTMILLVLAGSQ